MAYFSNEIRKLAKAANQRMLELEKRGYNSPALKSVYARLTALGREENAKGKLRFSETGKFSNKNEASKVEAVLRRFMNQKTSRLRGYKEYRKAVLSGLEKRFHYSEYGISDDEIEEFWRAMPDNEKDRLYGSEEPFIIVAQYKTAVADKIKRLEKRGDTDAASKIRENELSITDIVKRIHEKKSLTAALKAIDIKPTDYLQFKAGYMRKMGGF